jgi:hypothetical protein
LVVVVDDEQFRVLPRTGSSRSETRMGWSLLTACLRRGMVAARFLICARLVAAMSVNAAQSGTVMVTAALCRTAALMTDAPASSVALP